MLSLGGVLLVFVMVFGGYALAGGSLGIIMHALPLEMMIIGGAAIGALLIANAKDVVKEVFVGIIKVFRGARWTREDYRDLLCLLYLLTKVMRTKGMVGLEPHIENPQESKIFQQFPRVAGDHHVVVLICDTLRMITMNLDDAHQVEDFMERALEKHHAEAMRPASALQTMADGLPALGIVAAVLGVIKTMASIDKPVEILGGMIGSALVGTFLGVFLSYGFVGPFASRLKQIIDEEAQFYAVIRDTITAHLHGHATQVSVEIGRGNVPTRMQPSFYDLEEAINEIPTEVTA